MTYRRTTAKALDRATTDNGCMTIIAWRDAGGPPRHRRLRRHVHRRGHRRTYVVDDPLELCRMGAALRAGESPARYRIVHTADELLA